MSNGGPQGCIGKACDFVIKDDDATCESGTSTCSVAKLLQAAPSGFHPQQLIDVTNKINQILDAIPADPRGRTLSLLHTNDGSLLAWVDHKAAAPADGVRPDDDEATVARALRLNASAASGATAN